MRLASILLAAVAVLPAGAASAAAVLAPHRAVYDLVLDKADDRSGITQLSGRMVYEFNGSACEGYTTNFRFVTKIESNEASKMTDQQTTTFEEGNGKSFSFVTKSFVDQHLDKEVKGTATADDKGLKVNIEKPEPQSVDLARTQFPTQQLIELIGKAEKGESFYESNLFDGSEDADKVMTITVVVGKQADAPADDPERPVLASLAGEKVWPVDIAYFDLSGGGEEIPDYRISFKLHENGLTRDLTMEYEDFSMRGKLVDLKMLPADATCKK